MKRTTNPSGVKVTGLRLKQNQDGTFTDQYGRLLEKYIDGDCTRAAEDFYGKAEVL